MASTVLSIRVARGEPLAVHKGNPVEPTWETVFFLKEGARAAFNPYTVTRTHPQLCTYAETFASLTKDFLKVDSVFPVVQPTELSMARHTEQLSEWCFEILEKFVTLKEARKLRVAELIFAFYEVGESTRAPKIDAIKECMAVIRGKLLAGYRHPAIQGNARFLKNKRKEVKVVRRFDEWAANARKSDHFEQKFNAKDGTFHLFNPFTGEVIAGTQNGNRQSSHWRPPDEHPEQICGEGVSSTLMMPVFYGSRIHVRPFAGWGGDEAGRAAAARHICAVARGAIARARLRAYHRQRYHKIVDEHSNFYYFLDTWTQQTSWNKPLLAGAFDIREKPPDLRNDLHTEESGYCKGPVICSRLGKKNKGKVKPFESSRTPETDAVATAREPDMLDLEGCPYSIAVMWIDANVSKFELYQPLREMYDERDWLTLLKILRKRTDDLFAQMYCLHAFSRMPVTDTAGVLDNGPAETMHHLVDALELWTASKKYGCNLMQFLGTALLRILEHHTGRVAFFSTAHLEKEVASQGLSGEQEEYLEKKIRIFSKVLRSIPVEIFNVQVAKGSAGHEECIDDVRATPRGVEMVETVLQIIAVLLHERETRDLVCEKVGIYLVHALRVCATEPFVQQHGLRCIYNCVYMCPLGWDNMHYRTDAVEVLKEIRNGPLGGDEDVVRELHRCELALAPMGWAGHVERDIEIEMRRQKQEVFIEP